MKFVLRVDDVGWTPNGIDPPPQKAPDVGLKLAQRFHAVLGGLPWLAALIPSVVDEEGREWLRTAPQGLVPALHGWDHSGRNAHDAEFHGRSLQDCRLRIRKGREILKGLDIRHIVPPFNVTGRFLPAAAAAEGIFSIWGAPVDGVLPPRAQATDYGWFVPAWSPLYSVSVGRMSPGMVPLVEALPKLMHLPQTSIISLHLTWEYARSPSLDGLKRMVDLIAGKVISPAQYLEEAANGCSSH